MVLKAQLVFLTKPVIIDRIPVRLLGHIMGGQWWYDDSSDICNDINNNVYFSGYTRNC
jgi:hypothetical protein